MSVILQRFLVFSLSLFLVIAPIQQANAAVSDWAVTKAVSNGATTVVSATKGGYKNAVAVAPTAGRVGLQLLKRGNQLALLYAASQLLINGVDFVMSPDGNAVQYKAPALNFGWYSALDDVNYYHPTAQAAAAASCVPYGVATMAMYNPSLYRATCEGPFGGRDIKQGYNPYPDPNAPPTTKSIPLSTFANTAAPQVIANAASAATGVSAAQRAAAQAVTAAAAVASVIAGDFDSQLQSGAVPNGSDSSTATGSAGLAAGQAAADARAAADAATAQSNTAQDTAKDAADAARDASDAAQDLVNTGADEAAIAAADAASKAADAVSKAADDAAKAAADARARAADDAAARAKDYDKAARVAELRAKQLADEAAERLRDIADDAAESVKSAAKELADDAAKALEDAKAVRDLAKELLKDAELARDEAKEGGAKVDAKPFELPAFCTWAAPVCDAIDWLTKPAPDLDDNTELDISVPDVVAADTDINFGGSCPANFEVHSSIFGNPIDIVLFDTSKFCGFLSTFVKFPVYAASSLFALYILGGRKDG